MIRLFLATTDEDYATAGLLFKEYAKAININLDFQHFDEEIKGLKQMYSKPHGGIILTMEHEEIIGCVALRKLQEDIGELKRMYIRPGHQNKGIGKQLLEQSLNLARQCNYAAVRLDTLNHMESAIHLYKKAGFYEIPPYYNNPLSTALYFEKKL